MPAQNPLGHRAASRPFRDGRSMATPSETSAAHRSHLCCCCLRAFGSSRKTFAPQCTSLRTINSSPAFHGRPQAPMATSLSPIQPQHPASSEVHGHRAPDLGPTSSRGASSSSPRPGFEDHKRIFSCSREVLRPWPGCPTLEHHSFRGRRGACRSHGTSQIAEIPA